MLNRITSVFLVILLIASLSGSAYFMIQHLQEEIEYKAEEDAIEDIRDIIIKEHPVTTIPDSNENVPTSSTIDTDNNNTPQVTEDSSSSGDAIVIDPMLREIDFEYLMGINEDANRWVYIPDSTLDYPVMQERTVGEYFYLWRDIYKKSSTVGSVLTPAIPLDVDDPHIMFFGHTFSNNRDRMFYTVKKYYDKKYFDTHPYVYVYYPDRTEKWLAIEVRNVMAYDKVYNMPYIYGSDEYAELQKYLFSDYRQQLTDKIDGLTANDPILILSCCDRKYDYDDGRAILICRLSEVLYKDTGKTEKIS